MEAGQVYGLLKVREVTTAGAGRSTSLLIHSLDISSMFRLRVINLLARWNLGEVTP